jgi:phospholipid/cholesterol/gamma-HCH transport system permease protein
LQIIKAISIRFGRFLDNIGSQIITMIDFTGYAIILLFQSIFYMKNIVEKRKEIFKQMYIAGVKSFMVSSIVALFTGMILSLQAGIEMKKFGQQAYVGNLVVASLTREMSPFVGAVVLIASVGSAIAAEIATMKVSEEIDALQMMRISPVKFLVMPRVIALAIMFPIVAIYFTFLGTIGGGIVAYSQLDVSWDVYYQHVMDSLTFKPVYVGLMKSCIFGIIVSIVSCAKGLRAYGGALGVGQATRSSVIASFLLILVNGYFITAIFFGEKF